MFYLAACLLLLNRLYWGSSKKLLSHLWCLDLCIYICVLMGTCAHLCQAIRSTSAVMFIRHHSHIRDLQTGIINGLTCRGRNIGHQKRTRLCCSSKCVMLYQWNDTSIDQNLCNWSYSWCSQSLRYWRDDFAWNLPDSALALGSPESSGAEQVIRFVTDCVIEVRFKHVVLACWRARCMHAQIYVAAET